VRRAPQVVAMTTLKQLIAGLGDVEHNNLGTLLNLERCRVALGLRGEIERHGKKILGASEHQLAADILSEVVIALEQAPMPTEEEYEAWRKLAKG